MKKLFSPRARHTHVQVMSSEIASFHLLYEAVFPLVSEMAMKWVPQPQTGAQNGYSSCRIAAAIWPQDGTEPTAAAVELGEAIVICSPGFDDVVAMERYNEWYDCDRHLQIGRTLEVFRAVCGRPHQGRMIVSGSDRDPSPTVVDEYMAWFFRPSPDPTFLPRDPCLSSCLRPVHSRHEMPVNSKPARMT